MQDLGGLGIAEGPRTNYTWVPANVLPKVVPFLVLLGLLGLKRNRNGAAWLIWAPVLLGFGLEPALGSVMGEMPSEVKDVVFGVLGALSFAMASLWLLSGYMVRKHRVLSGLAMLANFAVVGGGLWLISTLVEGMDFTAIPTAITLAMSGGILTFTLGFTGLLCRKRFGRMRLAAWSLVLVVLFSLLAVAPLFVPVLLNNPSAQVNREVVLAILGLVTMNAGLLMLYLLLAFSSDYYRERLEAFLKIGAQEEPPVIAPPTAAEPQVAK